MLNTLSISQNVITGTNETFNIVKVNAGITPMISLQLHTTEIVFDLTQEELINENMACVYGTGPDEIYDFSNNSKEYLPQGTSYYLNEVGETPKIVVEGGGIVEDFLSNENDSGGNFVCYKTFTLNSFSNLDGWQLTVERVDLENTPTLEEFYIQDNSCKDQVGVKRGLFYLKNQEVINLITAPSDSLGYCQHLIVLALSLKGTEEHGEKKSKLIYTLLAPEVDFVP